MNWSIYFNLLLRMGILFQLGTLGAGNHYAEIQIVDDIYDSAAASRMGIERTGQVRRRGNYHYAASRGVASPKAYFEATSPWGFIEY